MQREGVVLKSYKDSVGVWTIGVGHAYTYKGKPITAGLTITRDEAEALLAQDLAKFEAAVNSAVKVVINQTEFDAMVSLAFNIGSGAFAKSSVVRLLNAGDRNGAANAFLLWKNAGGKPILLKRREAERRQFLALSPATQPAKAGLLARARALITLKG